MGKKPFIPPTKRELPFRDDGQEYAKVLQNLGDQRYRVYCYNGVECIARKAGSLRKNTKKSRHVRIEVDNLVLVSVREFQPSKVDILFCYTAKEANKLKALGELPTDEEINDAPGGDIDFVEEDGGITFEDI